MRNRRLAWGKMPILFLIAVLVLTRCVDFSNADISFPAIVTAIVVLLITMSGKRHETR